MGKQHVCSVRILLYTYGYGRGIMCLVAFCRSPRATSPTELGPFWLAPEVLCSDLLEGSPHVQPDYDRTEYGQGREGDSSIRHGVEVMMA